MGYTFFFWGTLSALVEKRKSIDSGDHAGSPLRNPQRAPAKRQRSAFCGKEEAPAIK